MIMALGADFWICLSLVGVQFLGFCFLPGFWPVWRLCIAHFPDMLSWCVHRECLLLLEAGTMGWVGGRKVEVEDGVREEMKTTEDLLLQSWGCNWGGLALRSNAEKLC